MAGIGEKPITRSGRRLLDGVGVGRGDDLVDLVPGGAHEAAEAAHLGVVARAWRISTIEAQARPASCSPAPRATAAAGASGSADISPGWPNTVPAVAGAARAAARLVVGQVRPRARIVGLLGLPGDDPALDVDLPRARAGAVHAVGRAHDLVVLPALAVGLLPVRLSVVVTPWPLGERAVVLRRSSGDRGAWLIMFPSECQAVGRPRRRGRTCARCRAAGRRGGCRRTR
jgi:hypothetical protein